MQDPALTELLEFIALRHSLHINGNHMWRVLILCGCSLSANAAAPVCQSTNPASVLLELFTSEGCSSCPPAEDWLAKIPEKFNQEQVITLAWHVDYWDYPGWKDEFANPQFSLRQRERVRASGSNNVYTPQLMINGQTRFWTEQPKDLIRQQLTLMTHPSLQLRAQQQNDGQWLLSVNTATLPDNTLLRAVLLGDTSKRKITGGENAGRWLSHPSPVLAYAMRVNGSAILNPGNYKAVRAVTWLERTDRAEVLAVSSVNLDGCR
jgi:hypothetical protein